MFFYWKLALLAHCRFLFLFFIFVGVVPSANAANVPITDSFGGLLGDERRTCDESFYDVLVDRATMEAQRELTQNQNIVPRPDSVLNMTCFDQFLDQQAWYADNFFPGDPQNSAGGFGNIFNELLTTFPDRIISNIDPSLSEGYTMFAVLEILVLDQLVDISGNPLSEALDIPGTALCGGNKEEYIDDNFPGFMLGNRANGTGLYGALSTAMDRTVTDGTAPPNAYTCTMMNDVWTQAKCYDFATESGLSGYGPAVDHDGFYTLLDYVAYAAAGGDYREHITQCDPPDGGGLVDLPSGGDLLCYTQTHGVPAIPVPTSLGGGGSSTGLPGLGVALLLGSNSAPSWATTSAGSNPAVGSAGAADPYLTHSDILTGACSPPIQTGFLVFGDNNERYMDAVCPEPACYFDPPSTITATGSCVLP